MTRDVIRKVNKNNKGGKTMKSIKNGLLTLLLATVFLSLFVAAAMANVPEKQEAVKDSVVKVEPEVSNVELAALIYDLKNTTSELEATLLDNKTSLTTENNGESFRGEKRAKLNFILPMLRRTLLLILDVLNAISPQETENGVV